LQVQTILYEGAEARDKPPRSIAVTLPAFIRSLAGAVRFAARHGSFGRISVAIGDCSPSPVLDDAWVARATAELNEAGASSVAYTPFGENLGHGGGHNALARAGQGTLAMAGQGALARAGHGAEGSTPDLLAFVNPDGVVSPSLLVELAAPFAEQGAGARPQAGAVAPGAPVGTPAGGRGIAIVEARQIPLELPKVYDPATGDTPWASAACCMVSREAFDSLEGFDSRSFFLHCDDLDLSWRARLAGYRVVYRPSAVMFHDKRLDERAALQVGEGEQFSSADGSLMIAWKYSRPDMLASWLEAYGKGSPRQRQAVEAFELCRAEHRLPKQIDPEHSVAEMTGGTWSKERFSPDE
jgi:hypothetical protein